MEREKDQAALRAAAADPARLTPLLDAVARRAAAGSPEAIETLVWAVDELSLSRPAIRRVVINEADVDDVAQDVLIAVAQSIGSFRGESHFTTWLNQVARFKAIAFLRRKRDDASIDGVDVSDAARISSMLASRETLRSLLDSLPDGYRQAVMLRDVRQLPYDEVARRLALNLNTAKSRVARGRALLAARLVES